VGGFPGWGEIFQMIHPGDPNYQYEMERGARKKSIVLKGLKKIFGN